MSFSSLMVLSGMVGKHFSFPWNVLFGHVVPLVLWTQLLSSVCLLVCTYVCPCAMPFSRNLLITFLWSYYYKNTKKKQTQKSGEAFFKEKFVLWPKWRKWVIFGPNVSTFEDFSKSVHYMFLKLYPMKELKIK